MYCTTLPAMRDLCDEREEREGIWNRKPQLQLIYHRARRDGVSPWAVLATVVTLRLGSVPAQVVAHDGSSLNSGAVIVGGPGSGKTVVVRGAEELSGVPASPLHGVSPIKVLAESVSSCTYHPATAPVRGIRIRRGYVPVYNEDVRSLRIEDLEEQDALRGILRGEWTLARMDERVLTKNASRVCMVLGAQPRTARELISADGGRLAASMLWAPSQDGVDRRRDSVGTPSPMTPLRFSLAGTFTSYHEAKVGDPARAVTRLRADDDVPTDDGLRCVVAAGLAQLWGADPITLEEWELAGLLIDVSRNVMLTTRNSTL